MSEAISPHLFGSVVNSIAHQNLRYLRQKAVDEYWDEKAQALAEKRAAETKKTRKARLKSAAKTKVTKFEIQEARRELILNFISLEPVEANWTPQSDSPSPHPVGSRKKFAERAGIHLGHYELLEDGLIEFSLDDAVKIARANDIDLATFLTPSMENLQSDTYLDLQPQNPIHGPVMMFEWLLWIHGYHPLPGQNPKKFREMNALPRVFIEHPVDSRRERDIEEREKVLKKEWGSTFNVMDTFAIKTIKRSKDTPLTPYEKSPERYSHIPTTYRFIIRSTLRFAAAIKSIFRTDNGTYSLKILKKRFTNGVLLLRNQAVLIVKLLIGLGK